METSPASNQPRKLTKNKKNRVERNFAKSIWTQMIYDLRDFYLPKEKRGNAAVDKAILFQIAAAGIPNSEYPESGCKLSTKILSIKLNMDEKTLEKRLAYLELNNLIINEYQGPFRPRLRYINHLEVQRLLKLQLKDLEKWELDQANKPENAKREYFIPTEYHLGGSDPWKEPLTPHIDTQLDTPIDAPLGAQLDTTIGSIVANDANTSHLRDWELSDCPTRHAWTLECFECAPAREEPRLVD